MRGNRAQSSDMRPPAKARNRSEPVLDRELEDLPVRIEALESEQRELGARLAGSELYQNEPQRAGELNARYAQIEEELMACLERWEALGAR